MKNWLDPARSWTQFSLESRPSFTHPLYRYSIFYPIKNFSKCLIILVTPIRTTARTPIAPTYRKSPLKTTRTQEVICHRPYPPTTTTTEPTINTRSRGVREGGEKIGESAAAKKLVEGDSVRNVVNLLNLAPTKTLYIRTQFTHFIRNLHKYVRYKKDNGSETERPKKRRRNRVRIESSAKGLVALVGGGGRVAPDLLIHWRCLHLTLIKYKIAFFFLLSPFSSFLFSSFHAVFFFFLRTHTSL